MRGGVPVAIALFCGISEEILSLSQKFLNIFAFFTAKVNSC